MKKALLLPAIIVFYGCQKDFTVAENDSRVNAQMTRSAESISEHYYWAFGEIVPLIPIPDKYFVLTDATDPQKRTHEFQKDGYEATLLRKEQNLSFSTVDLSDKKFEVIKKAQSFIVTGKELSKKVGIIYAAPFYKTPWGEEIGVSNMFSVLLKNEQDLPALKKLAEENNVLFLGKDTDLDWYSFVCTNESNGNALQMANLFHETELFKAAVPNFLIKNRPSSINDPLYPSQWNLHNASNPVIDINYNEALSSFEFPHIGNVTVAVYDNGLEFNHPDLRVLPPSQSYDITRNSSPAIVYRNQAHAHGMACAGIIAASHNGKGSAGIAPGVRLMSVSSEPYQYITDMEKARGFIWAAKNGADIISCSWEHGIYPQITDAITYAQTQGRNWKGCVIVFAAGNDNYRNKPGITAHSVPEIIVVGAIDKTGKRYEHYDWGSNYGTALDVMAPGTNIPTTDIQGSAGYSSDDYYNYFNGTSSACPHVAGIAALILAVNPNLTGKQVVDIIEGTAQKISAGDIDPNGQIYNYQTTPGRPNGTWDNKMGYGLVDAYAAVARAAVTTPTLPTPPVVNVSNYGYEWSGGMEVWRPSHYSTPWFTVQNHQAGVTYEWSSNWPELRTTAYAGMTHILYLYPPDYDPGYNSDGTMTVSAICRAKTANGQYSAWSNSAWIKLDWNPVPYYKRRADSINMAKLMQANPGVAID